MVKIAVRKLKRPFRLALCLSAAALLSACSAAIPEVTSLSSSSPSTTLSGKPTNPSNATTINIGVSGDLIVAYKYSLGINNDCSNPAFYTATEIPVSTLISGPLGADGTYTLCVIGKTATEDWDDYSSAAQYTWVKDTVAPTAILSGLPNPTSNTANLNVDVSGTDVVRYKFKLAINADCSDSSGYNTFSNVTANITNTIGADGAYGLCVVSFDAAGNMQDFASASQYSWIQDTTPPTVQLGTLPALTDNLSTLAISVGGTDVTGYKYKVGKSMNCVSASGYSAEISVGTNITDTLGSDGSYTVCVIGRDAVGNWQTPANSTIFTWTKDSTASTVTLANEPTGESNTTSLNITVGGVDIVQYKYQVGIGIDCTDTAAYSAPTAIGTNITDVLGADGIYDLCVIGEDSAGNWQLETAATTRTWVKDTVAPIATISGAPVSPSNETALNVTVGGVAVSSYKYKVDLVADCADPTGYSAVMPMNLITSSLGSDGSYILCVVGSDNAGNWQPYSSASAYAWTKDSTPPIATISGAPTGENELAIVNIDIGGTDVISYKYKLEASANCSDPTGYSTELSEGLNITDIIGADDVYTVCVVGKDSAGNWQSYAGASSATWTKLVPILVAMLNSDGSVFNNLYSTYSTDVSSPRTTSYFKTDREPASGTDQGFVEESSYFHFNGSTLGEIDPRVVSVSRHPTTGEYWALMSYGDIVKLNNDGSLDFNAACPFNGGCTDFVRFSSISVGRGDHLYLLDQGGNLFDARDLATARMTLDERVTQVAYW